MRRLDREIKDLKEILAIMKECEVCRLAFNDKEFPYILPLNFGLMVKKDKIELYFHGALEGTKYELIERDNRVSFEMDCAHQLVMDSIKKSCTMEYKSVIGHGHIEMVPEKEKYDALCCLMQHYHQEDFPFNQLVMPKTKVFKLVVEALTAKVHLKKKNRP